MRRRTIRNTKALQEVMESFALPDKLRTELMNIFYHLLSKLYFVKWQQLEVFEEVPLIYQGSRWFQYMRRKEDIKFNKRIIFFFEHN